MVPQVGGVAQKIFVVEAEVPEVAHEQRVIGIGVSEKNTTQVSYRNNDTGPMLDRAGEGDCPGSRRPFGWLSFHLPRPPPSVLSGVR